MDRMMKHGAFSALSPLIVSDRLSVPLGRPPEVRSGKPD